jgi:DNA-3-methyladenine glycosylase II
VTAVAAFFNDPENASFPWHRMNDEEVLKKLTSIKGVGTWTGQMILMFSLNRPDVFPVDDLGIRQTISELYGLEAKRYKDLSKEITAIADNWRPYRTYACKLLWHYKDA